MEWLTELVGPYGLHIREQFYLITPWESMYCSVDDVPPLLDQAVPWFLVLFLLDLVYCWKKDAPDSYQFNDTIVSTASGFVQKTFNLVVLRSVEVSIYVWAYENWCLYPLPCDSVWTWLVSFLVADSSYYWLHRATHEVNVLWCFHQMHHSSEYYNISTGLRQGIFQQCAAELLYLPQALFIPPSSYVVHHMLNRLYQLWIHTPVIGGLGPLEWVLNTPSHHRVHHGRNPYCIDKNYAGVLIVWDRLFGTFQPELQEEPVVYGLTTPVHTFDALRLQCGHMKVVWDKVGVARGWVDKAKAVLYGPGWCPGTGRLGRPEDIPQIRYPVGQYQLGVAQWVSIYCLVHGSACIIATQFLTARIKESHWLTTMEFGLAMIASIYILGLLLEKKKCGPVVEALRCLLLYIRLVPLAGAPHPIGLALQSLAASSVLFWTLALISQGGWVNLGAGNGGSDVRDR